MDYYVNEMYTELLKKLTSEIDSLKIDKNYPTKWILLRLIKHY